MNQIKYPEPAEHRLRYDFTDDLITVSMIDGENAANGTLKDYEYLLGLGHFSKTCRERLEMEKLNLHTKYMDICAYARPCNDAAQGYEYTEWWEDDRGSICNLYHSGPCPWYYDRTHRMYCYDYDLEEGNPQHTRTLINGTVVYDFRCQKEYIPSHWDGDTFVQCHRR